MTTTNKAKAWLVSFALLCSSSAALWSQAAAAQCDKCSHTLHATLNARLDIYSESRSEILIFHLMNDSDGSLGSAPQTWTLVVDGKEMSDSGMIFGNGPGPTDGYETVPSGTTFEFSKSLSLIRYFPEDRDYKVYWKSTKFRSNVVTVRGAVVTR